MDQEKFKKICKESFSIRQILKKLNLRPAGGNYATVHRLVKKWNIDTSHWTGQGHLKNKKHNWGKKISLEIICVENSDFTSSYHLKNRLIEESVFENECSNERCDVVNMWLEKPISLHLDHINGVRNDNRIENLRFLCPNCHSQTETYCGKNTKKKIGSKRFELLIP